MASDRKELYRSNSETLSVSHLSMFVMYSFLVIERIKHKSGRQVMTAAEQGL